VRKWLFLILLTLGFSGILRAQNQPFSDITLSSSGRPVGGASIAVCTNPGLATTAATVTANVATLTMSSNPITAGFVANQAIAVSGFTGADTYFNGGSVTSTGITNNFLVLAVTSTQIQYLLTHANATAATNGSVFQSGSSGQACAPLASITSDPAGLTPIAQPGFTSTGLGNYQFYAVASGYYIQFYGNIIGLVIKPIGIPCAPNLTCTITGSQTSSGNNTFTGANTFSGNFTATAGQNALKGTVNGAVGTATLTGADLGARINSALSGCGTDGCVIDMRGEPDPVTWSTQVTVSKPAKLLLPQGVISLTGTLPALTLSVGNAAGWSVEGTNPGWQNGGATSSTMTPSSGNHGNILQINNTATSQNQNFTIQGVTFDYGVATGNTTSTNSADKAIAFNTSNAATMFAFRGHFFHISCIFSYDCIFDGTATGLTATNSNVMEFDDVFGQSLGDGVIVFVGTSSVHDQIHVKQSGCNGYKALGTVNGNSACIYILNSNNVTIDQSFAWHGNDPSTGSSGAPNGMFGMGFGSGQTLITTPDFEANFFSSSGSGGILVTGGQATILSPTSRSNQYGNQSAAGTYFQGMIYTSSGASVWVTAPSFPKSGGSADTCTSGAGTTIDNAGILETSATDRVWLSGPMSIAAPSGSNCAPNNVLTLAGTIYNFSELNNIVTFGGTIKNAFTNISGIYRVTADQTITAGASLAAIPGLSWTMPANSAINANFSCHLLYSQATAAASDSFGLQDVTVAPTNIEADATIYTNATGTAITPNIPALTTTTATAFTAFTPSAAATVFNAYVYGTIEQPFNASTSVVQIMAQFTTNNGTIKRGSSCAVNQQ